MKKCPFCFEEIQEEAIFCKHCQNDLTTKTAKKAFEKMNRKSFWQSMKETGEKEQAKKEQQQKEREEYLKTLSPEQRKEEEHKEERKKWIKRLWWTAGIIGLIAFVNNAYWAMLIFLLAIWLHPTKEEIKPQLHFKFKEWNKYKLRIFFSVLAVFLCFVQIGIQQEELEKQRQAEFVQNYPVPKVQILSSQEKQGESREYLLEFTASDFTSVSVNGESLSEENSKFQKTISLENAKTSIAILAKNEHKQSNKNLVIERNETPEEEKARLEKEEQERIEAEKKKAEAERKRAEAQKEREAKANQEIIEKLQREIEGIKNFDGSQYHDNVMSFQIEIALFTAWATMIEEGKASSSQEAKNLASTLESKVRNVQKREFPKMRKAYGELMGKTLWEHNIEVKVFGAANGTMELVGGMFANNANIKDTQQTLHEMLKLLRFDRVNYKWFKYDDDYTYYKVESLNDAEITSTLE